jgi:CHAT domain
MKILILASNPRKDLNLEKEIRHLQGTIERSKNREDLKVEIGFAVQPEDLQGLLLKHEPDIVHFCGHGTGQQGLVLQEDTGLEKLVSTDALSNLFELCSQWVKCVLLNACYSEVQANAIVQHIDYAIGMNHEIRDDSAIAFATGFYQALGYGQPIEKSYKFGCNAIQLQISGNSNVRSVLSEERRKLEVATTVERVVIPEHVKPVLKIRQNLTTSVDPVPSELASELDQELNDSDREVLTELLIRSGRAEYSARKALCRKIGIEPNQLGFLRQSTDADFALELISHLHSIGNKQALFKICSELEIVFKGGKYSAGLENTKSKLNCNNMRG